MSNLINVNSVIKLNLPKIRQLTDAQITALEQTAEALHTEVVQAQVFPRDTGNLQNESTFLDRSESSHGKVSIISSTPYAAVCISIRNIIFRLERTRMPVANGIQTGFRVVKKLISRLRHSKKSIGG
jgi:hypothetical protein